MPSLIFTITILAPRVDHLDYFAAGLAAIQRQGIPQNIWIHPEDHKLLPADLTAQTAAH